jgi:hypothetical protein
MRKSQLAITEVKTVFTMNKTAARRTSVLQSAPTSMLSSSVSFVVSMVPALMAVTVLTLSMRVDAQHRMMSTIVPTLPPVSLQGHADTASGFFASSSWLVRAQGAVGKVTPPSGMSDEAELSEYPARDQAWILTMSQAATLYASASRTTVELRCSQQLYASRRNDISFNPRSAVWDEELTLRNLLPSSAAEVTVSVFHRCKHDIDNSDSEEGDSIALYSPQKRTIILGGAAISGVLPPSIFTGISSPLRFMMDARMEGYWYASDYRFPQVNFGASWTDMQGSLQAGLTSEYLLSSALTCGLRLSSTTAAFAASGSRKAALGSDYLAEVYSTVKGNAGDVMVSLQWRRTFDHGIRISADPASIASLTITLRSH